MIELLIWLGSVAVFLAAGVAAGWHLGRAREMKRVSQRVSIVLGQVERRHKKELGRFQAGFAKQARELKEARAKQHLREAAHNLAQAQAQAQGRSSAPKQKQAPSEHGFAPTQPMQHVNH
jgi:hypothetical protein